MLTAYQLHLPSDVRVFQHMAAPTYSGPEALVKDTLEYELWYQRGAFGRGWYRSAVHWMTPAQG